MALSTRSDPVITILLLCYNQERFAAEAVRGVISQTYSPLEIIIFDDCSSDRTREMIEGALAENPTRHEVQFIRNPANMHSNAVVRKGLAMAKGKFLFVSHGDDVMLPEMVEQMAQVWIREKVSLVTANAHYIDADSKPLNRTFQKLNETADESFETLARDGANACCFGPAIGFEREIYEKFGWVPRYLRAYDLMYPFYAYLLKGAKFINRPLLKYRVHQYNTSLSLAVEKSDARKRAMVEERIFLGHLAHATLMLEEIDRLIAEDPGRYAYLRERIVPLLNIQLAEVAKKLVHVSRTSGALASPTAPET